MNLWRFSKLGFWVSISGKSVEGEASSLNTDQGEVSEERKGGRKVGRDEMARLCGGGGPEQFVAARVQHLVMEF